MNTNDAGFTIVVADDDADDRMLIKRAFKKNDFANQLDFVQDGEELMEYLQRQKEFGDLTEMPLPGLIILDLNMPRKDGREVLRELKNNPVLRRLPVVVFTTSQNEDDVEQTYALGVNSFIVKPVSFSGFVSVIKALKDYWTGVVRLPSECASS